MKLGSRLLKAGLSMGQKMGKVGLSMGSRGVPVVGQLLMDAAQDAIKNKISSVLERRNNRTIR